MVLAGAAMYVGAARVPQLLSDLEKRTTDQPPKLDSTPPLPDRGALTQKAGRGDSEVGQAGKDESPVTKLDVTRISQDGPSVIAGHAAPFQTLTLMENGKPFATVKADAKGDWVLVTEHKFERTDPQISFRVGAHVPQTEAAVTMQAEAPVPAQPETPVRTRSMQRSGEKQPATTGEASLSPATAVMKRFEGLVIAAREEAKRKEAEPKEAKRKEPERKQSDGESASLQTPDRVAEQTDGTSSSTEPRPQLHAKAQPSLAKAAPAVTEPAAPIPVPITFIYDEATLTAEGRRAAALLLEYAQLKDFNIVTLTGHADERGTHEYNMDLSRERLGTIARFLRDGGFKGQLDLIAKGETEPFSAVDRTRYGREDLWQLDRRVELHGAQ